MVVVVACVYVILIHEYIESFGKPSVIFSVQEWLNSVKLKLNPKKKKNNKKKKPKNVEFSIGNKHASRSHKFTKISCNISSKLSYAGRGSKNLGVTFDSPLTVM